MVHAALPDTSSTTSVGEIAVGDHVQWESNGQLMFATPLQVVAISADGQFIFVCGRGEPLPRAEVTAVMQSASVVAAAVGDTPVRHDIFMLKEGIVLMQYPAYLTAQSFDDLTDWLLLQHRKIGRHVDNPRKPRLTRVDAER